jgi:integrase
LFVVDPNGRAYGEREDSFSKEFRNALIAAGLSQLHFHGLRHTAATALADAGCPSHHIMAITGHKTLSMVERYTKRADQKRNAKAAMALLERTGTEQESAKPQK